MRFSSMVTFRSMAVHKTRFEPDLKRNLTAVAFVSDLVAHTHRLYPKERCVLGHHGSGLYLRLALSAFQYGAV